MEAWERLGYESENEYYTDRFSDEVESEPETTCGDCDYYHGHPANHDYGWCSRYREWAESKDPICDEE